MLLLQRIIAPALAKRLARFLPYLLGAASPPAAIIAAGRLNASSLFRYLTPLERDAPEGKLALVPPAEDLAHDPAPTPVDLADHGDATLNCDSGELDIRERATTGADDVVPPPQLAAAVKPGRREAIRLLLGSERIRLGVRPFLKQDVRLAVVEAGLILLLKDPCLATGPNVMPALGGDSGGTRREAKQNSQGDG